MKDGRDTPQVAASAVPECPVFDPYSHARPFEDRRFPAGGDKPFTRWRDVEPKQVHDRDFVAPSATDGAMA
jgi:hypothetical protein